MITFKNPYRSGACKDAAHRQKKGKPPTEGENMGLETNVNSIQDLNQNWPPVSDPRAQGADHLRNLKKAIQLTFPNLKQCLLNDAQFTALGTLVGDGSGTFTVDSTLTVNGTLLVPSVTDWATQQAVPAKDADRRYMKPGDADGRYVSKAQGPLDYAPLQAGVNISTGNIWLSYKASDGTVKYTFAQQAGDYATNTALTAETTRATTVESNLQSSKANLNGGNTFSGNQAVNGWLTLSNGNVLQTIGGNGSVTVNHYTDQYGSATIDLNNAATGANISWFKLYQDGMLRTNRGDVAFTSQLPFSDTGLKMQVFTLDIAGLPIVSFPTAFRSGTVPQVLLSWSDNEGGPNGQAFLMRQDITNSNFSVHGLEWNGSGWQDSHSRRQLTVLAIGYF